MSKKVLQSLILWSENLLAEIYKITGKRYQQIEAKVDKSFVQYLALFSGQSHALLVGWDSPYNVKGETWKKEIQWAVIGTEFGSIKFIEGGEYEIPTEGIQEVEKEAKENGKGKPTPEPPEIDDWYEQIGAMKT